MKKSFKKKSLAEATKTLKEIVYEAHQNSKHKNTGSRLKSMFGFQKTSIGMFLDFILEEYKKSVSAKDFNEEVEELFKLMNKRQDIWDKYQKGGDYPFTFNYATILMIESMTTKKADKKTKDKAAEEMLDEIRYSGLD